MLHGKLTSKVQIMKTRCLTLCSQQLLYTYIIRKGVVAEKDALVLHNDVGLALPFMGTACN